MEPLDANAGPLELHAMLDALLEGLQVLDFDWRYLYVNDAVARHGRKAREELLGKTMLECYPGIEKTPLFPVMQTCMRERRSEQLENEFVYEDGERAWFELRIRPCPEGLIVLSVDITERKRLEKALQHAHKLRALGQMAAGVAHDLKNILNPLGLQVQVLKRKLREYPEPTEILDQMSAVLRRGTQTIDRLRDFSRQSLERPPTIAVNLNEIAEEALQILDARIAQHGVRIAVRKSLGDVPSVQVSAPELLSVIVNLLVNAVEALPDGGAITLRTGCSRQGPWLEVEDDGIGMAPDVQRRMLEPFFTTKGDTGMGLGLAMVDAFMTRQGGKVQLHSAPGEGTTVTLAFGTTS